MDKYVGIIAAEFEEMEAIKTIMENISEIDIYNLKIYSGKINNKPCLLTRCGVGKVNAARTTQILCDRFDIKYIINLGSAGAVNDSLDIGDIVVAEKLVQHDFDVTAFGREKGFIPETGKFFNSDKSLCGKFNIGKLNDVKIVLGTIASGDTFCTDIAMKEEIKNTFNCDCVEMEGAAVAQVCFLNNIPFVVIRSISDKLNSNNQIDFNLYLKLASKNCGDLLRQVI